MAALRQKGYQVGIVIDSYFIAPASILLSNLKDVINHV